MQWLKTIVEIANTGSQDPIYKLLITDHDLRKTHHVNAAVFIRWRGGLCGK